MTVHISARGRRTADGEAEPIAFEADGVLTALPEGHRLVYTPRAPEDPVRTTLTCTPGEVTIFREAAPPSLLRLREGRRWSGDYATPYGPIPVVTAAERLRDDLSRGELELRYSLELGGGALHTALLLTVKNT